MTGQEIYNIAKELFPINRSLMGEGNRKTLELLKKYNSRLKVVEVPCGTKVFDWTIPEEWFIEEAYVENGKGERILDFKDRFINVMGYSEPVDVTLSLEEFKEHLFTLPNQPQWTPYVTSYYKKRWGFCMSQEEADRLPEDNYHCVIKSGFKADGSLSYGEIVIPGETDEEIFLSTYICHPDLANDDVSGPALTIALADFIEKMPNRRFTYRIVFAPETIGAITYLAHENHYLSMKEKVKAGFVLTCVGDDLDYSYVESRYSDTLADKVMANVLKYHYPEYHAYPYLERGSDERQYQAPGIDIPLICFCRSKFGEFPQYHTSADDMDFVSPEGFSGAFEVMTQVIKALEYNKVYKINVLCEPQLGKRDLIPNVSKKGTYDAIYGLTRFIAYADGRNDLIDISNRIRVPVSELTEVVDKLMEKELLDVIS